MNRKGLTIVELLAALVIMGIVATIIGLLINSYQDANDTISESSKASLEASLLIQNIENDLDEFSPTDYTSCTSPECVTLTKSFEYIYNEGQIILQTYDPVLSQNLIFENQQLSFGSITYDIDGFSLSNDTSINVSEFNGYLSIQIDFFLVSETTTYPFTMTYSFAIEATPTQ